MPDRIKSLPVNEQGRPVPWFVEWIDGKPDFRIMDSRKRIMAINKRLCWICGRKLGKYMVFVAGPMCAINRVSAEPPSHRECAEFALRACPFLMMPKMVRNEHELPSGTDMPGIGILRNPGVFVMWVTQSYKVRSDGTRRGFVFSMGEATEVHWYREGKTATRDEVLESIESGRVFLIGESPEDDALQYFKEQQLAMMHLLPIR